MNFSTPAKSFKRYGVIMVNIQSVEQKHEELRSLLEAFAASPTMKTWHRLMPSFPNLMGSLNLQGVNKDLLFRSPHEVHNPLFQSLVVQWYRQHQDLRAITTQCDEAVTYVFQDLYTGLEEEE